MGWFGKWNNGLKLFEVVWWFRFDPSPFEGGRSPAFFPFEDIPFCGFAGKPRGKPKSISHPLAAPAGSIAVANPN